MSANGVCAAVATAAAYRADDKGRGVLLLMQCASGLAWIWKMSEKMDDMWCGTAGFSNSYQGDGVEGEEKYRFLFDLKIARQDFFSADRSAKMLKEFGKLFGPHANKLSKCNTAVAASS